VVDELLYDSFNQQINIVHVRWGPAEEYPTGFSEAGLPLLSNESVISDVLPLIPFAYPGQGYEDLVDALGVHVDDLEGKSRIQLFPAAGDCSSSLRIKPRGIEVTAPSAASPLVKAGEKIVEGSGRLTRTAFRSSFIS